MEGVINLLLILAPGIVAGFAGLWLAIPSLHPRPIRVSGLAAVGIAALQVVSVVAWFANGCYETWQPCEGSVQEAIFVATVGGCLAAAVLTLIYGVVRRARRSSRSM